jgi:hypothetical protein
MCQVARLAKLYYKIWDLYIEDECEEVNEVLFAIRIASAYVKLESEPGAEFLRFNLGIFRDLCPDLDDPETPAYLAGKKSLEEYENTKEERERERKRTLALKAA